MIILDQASLDDAANELLFSCIRQTKLTGGTQPTVFFEGTGNKQVLSQMFGFAPTVTNSLLAVFQRVDASTMIVDQLRDEPHESSHEFVAGLSTDVSFEGEVLNQTETVGEAVAVPIHRRLGGMNETKALISSYLERLRETLPVLSSHPFKKDVRSTMLRGRALDSLPPPGKVYTILLNQEATFSISAPTSKCSNSKPTLPASQPNNFLRDWLEITLTIDEPQGGGEKAVGQFIGVYHKNEIVTNMARRPGTNNWKSVGWFVGYNKIAHVYDTDRLYTVSYAPENVPMNNNVQFDTSVSFTYGASMSGTTPGVSYSQGKTEGTSVSYSISDWDVRKVSESANQHAWYHTNNKPYNGRDYANKFPPSKSPGYSCSISKEGKLYSDKACNPYWASTLSTDSGICSQNMVYRTKTNTGYQTKPITFTYSLQSQYAALESYGKKGFFSWHWEACSYYRNFNSGNRQFTVDMTQVTPATLN